MPYLSQLDLTRARSAQRSGFGQAAAGSTVGRPHGGTAAEWEAYESRIRWRRVKARTGPRGEEWAKHATWAAWALRRLIEGEPVTVPPFPTDPELLALIVNGRVWLVTMPEWELKDLFPGLTTKILQRARRLLLPGQDVVRIAQEKLLADAEKLAADHARMVALRAELARYEKFANDTLQQFQTYIAWFKRHEEKKEERTEIVSRALTVIASALYWVPVVGWALGAIVDAANIAMQIDRMKAGIEAMMAAGVKVEGARVYIALQEALIQAIAEVEYARDELDWMHALTQEQLKLLAEVGPLGPPLAPSPAADAAIVGGLRREAGSALRAALRAPGKLVAAGLVAAVAVLALFGRRRGA